MHQDPRPALSLWEREKGCTTMHWDWDTIRNALLCLIIATPLAYLWSRANYHFALEHLPSWRDREEARKQYHILVAALASSVVAAVTNVGFVGLLASALLVYLAFRVLKSQVTILTGSGLGPRGLKGYPFVLGPAILYLGYAAFLALFAISPWIPR